MKYNSIIPLSALIFYFVAFLLWNFGLIPSPDMIIEWIDKYYEIYSLPFLFLVILIESIVYLGFYFPGQFLAVTLVILSEGSFLELITLSFISILAVTISAFINYYLGYYGIGSLKNSKTNTSDLNIKNLLISMIHINFLALYVYKKGAEKSSKKIILFTGLLNIPYYMSLIFIIFLFKDSVRELSKNSVVLITILTIWFLISLYFDIKKIYDKRSVK